MSVGNAVVGLSDVLAVGVSTQDKKGEEEEEEEEEEEKKGGDDLAKVNRRQDMRVRKTPSDKKKRVQFREDSALVTEFDDSELWGKGDQL